MHEIARGAVTGIAVGALGFVALAVLVPPAPRAPGAETAVAQADPPPEAPPEAPALPSLAAATDALPDSQAPAATPPAAPQPDGASGLPPADVASGSAADGAATAVAAALTEPRAPDPRPEPLQADAAAPDLPPAGRLTPGATVAGVETRRLPQIAPDVPAAPVAVAEPARAPLSAPPAPTAGAEPPQPEAAAPDLPPAGRLTPGATVAGVETRRLPQIAPETPAADLAAASVPPPPPAAPVEGVRTGRLPQIAAPEAPATAQAPASADTRPAWQRHRADFDPQGRPPVGVVLFDPANAPLAEAALLQLPFVATVALDPFDADAPRRAAQYRQRGHEVVLTIDGIAPRASVGDLDVLFAAWAQDFPDALGVVELPPGDGRRARALAPALVPTLADLGLALLAPDRGLSPLLTAGRGAGLPVAGLYRQIDAETDDAATLRRHLDRAGFEAERLGAIAIFARADRPETLEALTAWLATPRAARVAVAPVGAVIAAP